MAERAVGDSPAAPAAMAAGLGLRLEGGPGMAHRHFGTPPDEERRRWQDPDDILRDLPVGAGMTFVDVGCGHGYFAIPAARRVGAKGRVIAIDIDEERLHVLLKRAVEEGLDNVETILGKGESSVPCRGCADIVFFGTVLHDFEDPAQVIRNARLILKPGGRLVNLDWRKEEMEMGPPAAIRFDERRASDLIAGGGFDVVSVAPSGSYHYLVVAVPRPSSP